MRLFDNQHKSTRLYFCHCGNNLDSQDWQLAFPEYLPIGRIVWEEKKELGESDVAVGHTVLKRGFGELPGSPNDARIPLHARRGVPNGAIGCG